MSYNARDIANFVINYSNDNNIRITNLKLQKLLYYIQAAFLVEKNKTCFEESIVNWKHGPVVPEVYNEFKNYGASNIDRVDEYETIEVTDDFLLRFTTVKYDDNLILNDDKRIIKKIINTYKDSDPWDLVEKTHQERPYTTTSQNEEISEESIKGYFSEEKNKKRIYKPC